MARRSKKACAFPDCAKVTTAKHGYCIEHRKAVDKNYEKTYRKPRPKRYSTRAWQNTRKLVINNNPFCADPFAHHIRYDSGLRIKAEEVDHIDGNPENNREDNLQGLCKSCHSRKTAQERWHSRPKDHVYTAPYSREEPEGGEAGQNV